MDGIDSHRLKQDDPATSTHNQYQDHGLCQNISLASHYHIEQGTPLRRKNVDCLLTLTLGNLFSIQMMNHQ
jgi:hypothetical protein